jgi:hypothetical protein
VQWSLFLTLDVEKDLAGKHVEGFLSVRVQARQDAAEVMLWSAHGLLLHAMTDGLPSDARQACGDLVS